MTTIISLLSQDYVVLGSDSLGTATVPVIAWDRETRLSLRRAEEGRIDTADVVEGLESRVLNIPAYHTNHEDKVFCLPSKTHSFGVAHAGASSIGDRKIKEWVSDFAETSLNTLLTSDWTLETVASSLKHYLKGLYEEHGEEIGMELMLCGFQLGTDDTPSQPGVAQISIARNKNSHEIDASLITSIKPGLFVEGRKDEIEKLHLGMTKETYEQLYYGIEEEQRHIIETANRNLEKQYDRLERYRKRNLPSARKVKREFLSIDDFDTPEADELVDTPDPEFNYGRMSTQTAIDLVDFLINLQIKVDEFSLRPPTVGGDIQLALIRKQGFTWISQHEWRHGLNSVRRDD